jgi:hypothetical protein
MSDRAIAMTNDFMAILDKRNPEPLEVLGACIVLIGVALAPLEEEDRNAALEDE